MLSLTVSLTESATGLTHLDARWYNPYSQRFVQPDYWSFQNTGLPLEVQHELLRFSRLDTQQLLADPSQQLAYGYVAGNALAWNDQMGLGLFSWAKEKASSAGRKIKERSSKISKKLSSIKESSKSYWVNKGSKYVNDNSTSGKLKYGLSGAAYVLADSFPGSTTDVALYAAGGAAGKAIGPLATKSKNIFDQALNFFKKKPVTKDGDLIRWPPNKGFDDKPAPATLLPGIKVDRYGSPKGSYVSPEGTPLEMRSLPKGSDLKPLNSYQVVKPIEVEAGNAAPWFNQPGGGTQFKLPIPVQELIDTGYLK